MNHNFDLQEENLWKAVIMQAIIDAINPNFTRRFAHLRIEAISWLTGGSEDFHEVCLRAGLDANYVRVHAKKAIANPPAYRTLPGQSARYLERKLRRAHEQQRLQDGLWLAVTPKHEPITHTTHYRFITAKEIA